MANELEGGGGHPTVIRLRRKVASIHSVYQALLLLVVVGIVFYVAAETESPGWTAAAGLLSAGLSIAVDRAVRRRGDALQMHRDVVALTSVYYQEPQLLADMLQPEWIEESIRNLVKARLGDEQLGGDYTSQAVLPLLRRGQYRWDFVYDIELADLQAPIALDVNGVATTLDPSQYRRIESRLRYQVHDDEPHDTYFVAIVFSHAELSEWFRKPNVLLREVVHLPDGLAAQLVAAFGAQPDGRVEVASAGGLLAPVRELMANLVVRLGDDQVEPRWLRIDDDAISFEFELPGSCRAAMLRDGAKVVVEMDTVSSVDRTSFPVGIAVPTRYPLVTFQWDRTTIPSAGVSAEVFYSAHRPFDARTDGKKKQRISVETDPGDWVFAGSGCVFMWR